MLHLCLKDSVAVRLFTLQSLTNQRQSTSQLKLNVLMITTTHSGSQDYAHRIKNIQ